MFFFTKFSTNEIISEVEINTTNAYGVIDTLYHTIQEKKNDDPTKSYTAKLLQGKQNSMLKKLLKNLENLLLL